MSYLFDSSAKFLSRSVSGVVAYNDMTACGWAKVSSFPSTFAAPFRQDVNSGQAQIYAVSGGLAAWTSAASDAAFSSSPSPGQWFFWAYTHSSGGISFYWGLNDTTWVSQTRATLGDSFFSFLLGWNDLSISTLHVSNVKLWDAVLTETQMQAERAETVQRSADLYGYWPLTTISTNTDASGNGNTLTVNGGASTSADQPTFFVGGSAIPVIAAGLRQRMNN
jgi:hypothetical protein